MMAGINYIAIVIAAVASMAFGAAYYMALAKTWMAAANVTQKQTEAGGKTPFIIAFFCELVMALTLAFLFAHATKGGGMSLSGAMQSGFYLWLGFIITTQIVNHRYSFKPWALTIIDGGHWLGVILIQCAVLALI